MALSCFCIKLSTALVFPHPDGPIINILYGHFLSSSLLFLFVIASKLNIFVCLSNER